MWWKQQNPRMIKSVTPRGCLLLSLVYTYMYKIMIFLNFFSTEIDRPILIGSLLWKICWNGHSPFNPCPAEPGRDTLVYSAGQGLIKLKTDTMCIYDKSMYMYIYLLQSQESFGSWILAQSMRDRLSTKFIQIIIWPFYCWVRFDFLYISVGKMLECHFLITLPFWS